MRPEEMEKSERALRNLVDLRMRGNENDLTFMEGKFLNMVGKVAELLSEAWMHFYIGHTETQQRAASIVVHGMWQDNERLHGLLQKHPVKVKFGKNTVDLKNFE